MTKRNLPRGAALVLGLALCGGVWATTLVESWDLEQLVGESRRALLAEVAGVRYGQDERGLHATWLTLRVEDPVYGSLPARGEELEIKLYGAPVESADGSRVFVEGTPDYREGQRWLLLLLEPSAWGFSGTAGLLQGAFRVGPDDRAESAGGNRQVFGARGLGQWIDRGAVAEAERPFLDPDPGAVPYGLLRRAIVELWQRGRSSRPRGTGP